MEASAGAGVEIVKDGIIDLYETVKENPYRVEKSDEKEAYKRLMDHVDGIEKRDRKQRHYYLKRGAAVFLFSGLTATLVCSLTVEPTNHWRLLKQRMWQWVAMTIMITGVFSIVPFLTFLAFWPFKRILRTHKYAVYFLRRMKHSLDVTLWAFLVLLGWYAWFRRRLRHVHGDLSMIIVGQITRLLIALCIGCLLWSLKNVLHLKLKADLHYDQLFDRITQTIVYLNGLYVLTLPMDTHKDPFFTRHHNKMTKICLPAVAEGKYIWMDIMKMRKETAPIWILRRLCEEYLKEVNLYKFRPSDADQLLKDDRKLLDKANNMFNLIVNDEKVSEITRYHLSRNYGLSKEELDHFFKRRGYGTVRHKNTSINDEQAVDSGQRTQQEGDRDRGHEQAQQNGRRILLEGDRAIHADKFLNWAVRAHKNSWSLESTLKSSRIAFIKLNRMLSAFLLVLMIIIWLLLSKIVNTGQLALLFTPFLAASFMFENSSKNMFQGIIFAFAMHPFDVGDRVIIEDTQMRVKVMHILTSVFIKYDTGAEVIFPNSKLATTKIINLDITPDQSDQLDFIIDIKTPLEDVKDLELQIQKLLDDDLFYAKGTNVVKSRPKDPANKEDLMMTVHFKYLVSYLTADTKASRRSDILTRIIKLVKTMNDNRIDFPPHYVPFDLELTIPKDLKTSGIDHLKRKIKWSLSLASDEWVVQDSPSMSSSLAPDNRKEVQDSPSLRPKGGEYKYCKAVMTDLKDDHIKISLFVSKSEEIHPPDNVDVIGEDLDSNGFFIYVNSLLFERRYIIQKVLRDGKEIFTRPPQQQQHPSILETKLTKHITGNLTTAQLIIGAAD